MVDNWDVSSDTDLWMKRRGTGVFRLIPAPPPSPPPSREKAAAGILPSSQSRHYGTRPGLLKLYCSVCCGVQSVCYGVQVVLQCLLRCSSCTAVSVAVFRLYCSICCGRTGRVVLQRLLWPDWAGCTAKSVVVDQPHERVIVPVVVMLMHL